MSELGDLHPRDAAEAPAFWTDCELAPELLIPHPRNPKKHPPEQIAQIRANIREYGFTRPVLITAELLLLAGHGATEAAVLEGLPSIPCRMRSPEHPLTEAQVLALLIADNRIPQNGMWDESELAAILGELDTRGFDLDLTGFAAFELAKILAPEAPPTNNEAGAEHWRGMPEFSNPNNCFRKVVVNFATQADVDRFFELIGQEATEATRSIWFPPAERRDLESKRWGGQDGAPATS